MLTNRRSTMMVPPSRMPSWHPQSKPYEPSSFSAPLSFDTEILPSRTPSLLTSTTASMPSHRVVRVVGACHGTTTCARKDMKSFMKNLANSFGGSWGEPKSVTSLIYQTRDQAIDRLVKEAIGKGANAVVGLEVRESEIMGCIVVSASGTACFVEKERAPKRDSAQEDPFA
ncbi:hypothetical protein EK21DRAFT_95202 [Setomelanomma holmii]|uniref:Heavy metal-binding domain-containing protein n=1 Tax=Setomelanomma holmii TaxID=210430 RepID=A0A9P4GUQ8_9PLEO|nr:hypothetical protein EK21DRAFT_95202 [Setomelanomma holmii]